ncbi:MAG: TonB-dependent receptor [Saprospiraceae bacterium]|nr:TonB-dependent receptor [Saprospiraceae bacterium]
MIKIVHICLCTLLISVSLNAQRTINRLEAGQYAPDTLISILENTGEYSLSYNPEILTDLPLFTLEYPINSLDQLVSSLKEYPYIDLEINEQSQRIIITKSVLITISGLVIDSLSGESLPEVLVYNSTKVLGFSNLDGFFSITVNTNLDSVSVNLFGYESQTFAIDQIQSKGTIKLVNLNTLENVVITNTNNDSQFEDIIPDDKIRNEHLSKSQGISGNSDVFSYLRMLPGVSVGSEGQNGLSVRGGSPDQNLILLDGIQIYEASHLGGLNSIFITDAIKYVQFYKSAFPSRFGGKLSSVLDVRLKDGNRNTFSRSFSAGIEGIEGHIEGPLGENTSINLNGKLSWFSLIASPLIEDNLDFNNTTLRYSDGYAKFSHWFTPSSRLSFSFYNGEDVIRLSRNAHSAPAFSSFTDVNRIEWGNRLIALNWNVALSDAVFLTSSLGVSNFNYSSRGSYNINYTENDTIKSNSFDILSTSDLRDISLQSTLDYYSEKSGKYSLGTQLIRHINSPSIIESEEFLDPEIINTAAMDSTYKSMEFAIYADNTRYLGKYFTVNGGIRLSYFGGLNNNFFYVLPRASMSYEKNNFRVGASYSRMNQFIHLLVNPGPGLPSDLWVPSTENIEPELSDNIDIEFQYNTGHFSFGINGFYKFYKNVIEYSNDSDIFYSLIIDNERFNVSVNNSNWEERVSIGRGVSYGAEFKLGYSVGKFEWHTSYTLSKSERKFEDFNNGEAFPYKYDRPHNFSSIVGYSFNDNHAIQLNFAYGTGNAFTAATTEIKSIDCTSRPAPSSRNNARVPDFHHLDILYTGQKANEKGGVWSYSIGVYNIYNRLNPFYVYLFQDPETQNFDEFRKISIYPILPKLNIKYSW